MKMNPTHVYSVLQDACRALEASDDHAIAAYVGLAMALVQDKYGVGQDHLEVNAHD